MRCDALIALAEAQNRAGDNETAEANFERAATLARAIGDPERLASAALRAGPLNGLGPVVTNAEQVRLLEEALALLPAEDSHLRAMVMARLGLVMVYSVAVPGQAVVKQALQLDTEAVQMARRLNDRSTLAYALNARIHALWGIAAAPERLAAGRELGEIAEDVGDELLAVHGHMWRVRELLARGDVDAVNDELSQFAARDTAPPHPLVVSLSSNLAAMMALVTGEFDDADRFARTALETAEGYNDMAFSFYGALMAWTWWQHATTWRPSARPCSPSWTERRRSSRSCVVRWRWSTPSPVTPKPPWPSSTSWPTWAGTGSGTTSRKGRPWLSPPRRAARWVMQRTATRSTCTRSCGPTPAPPSSCGPRPRRASVRPTSIWGCSRRPWEISRWRRCTSRLRCGSRCGCAARPFLVAAEVELARTLRQRGREGDEERVAVLLRHAEESAVALGLHRLVRRAAEPG